MTPWRDALARNLRPGPMAAGPDDLCVMPYTVRLAVLPFFYVTGMQGSMSGPLFTGATVVLLPRWDRDPPPGWSSATGAQKPFDMGITYVEGYGLSEIIAPSHINPPEQAKKPCLVVPLYDVDSRVVDADFRELPPGEAGEIVTCGPQVFRGYWNNPQATAAAFVDIDGKRFFRTGDIGRIDDDGYFFMVDRLKRMINASGYKVWPAEVEALLYGHPAIQEACVIGATDAHRGETVKAIVVIKEASRGQVSEQDVIDWARANMAAYKAPRIVAFVDALPKSATGKILWRALQEKQQAV